MEIHPADIVISIINIIVLFFLLRMILWKHIDRFLTERNERIKKEIDDAGQLHKEAEDLLCDYKLKIANYEEQGQEIIQDSRQQAGEEAEKIIEEAKATAEKMISDAQLRIEIERAQALKDTRADIAQLATQMAARILEREVSKSDNIRTVEDFFKE